VFQIYANYIFKNNRHDKRVLVPVHSSEILPPQQFIWDGNQFAYLMVRAVQLQKKASDIVYEVHPFFINIDVSTCTPAMTPTWHLGTKINSKSAGSCFSTQNEERLKKRKQCDVETVDAYLPPSTRFQFGQLAAPQEDNKVQGKKALQMKELVNSEEEDLQVDTHF
jgi:hypothetical protein